MFTEVSLTNLREVLRVDRVESPQFAWLTTDTGWFGYAISEIIYAEDEKEEKQSVGKQLQFAGLFPVENPQYSICIVSDSFFSYFLFIIDT